MIKECLHNSESLILINLQKDYTRTLSLRNAFVKEIRRRFLELKKVIKESIVDNDCFGLESGIKIYQLNPATKGRFALPLLKSRVDSFMTWLWEQYSKGILELKEIHQYGTSIKEPWTNWYVWQAYGKGVSNARQAMKQARLDVPSIDKTGGISAALFSPVHVERLGLLYSQCYDSLTGITQEMSLRISRVLTEGMLKGKSPRELANDILEQIDGDLTIVDKLGRKITPLRRAEMLARTEIIRAHAEGQLQEYLNWRVEEVELKVELVTTSDPCPKCAELANKTYKIEEARGLIPVHPNCRCAWVPVSARQKQKRKEKYKLE